MSKAFQDQAPSGFFPAFTKKVHLTAYPAINHLQPALSAANKVVFVTGGGRGIGKAIAMFFAAASSKTIAIMGREQTSLQATKAAIEEEAKTRGLPAAQVLMYAADITNAKAVSAAAADVASKAGPIDVVVNNAGIAAGIGNLADADMDEWWRSFEVNVRGSLNVVRAFLAHKASGATLINISTGAVHTAGGSGVSSYTGAKAALLKPLATMTVEHPDVRLFNIQPGVIATDLTAKGTRPPRDDISLPASFCVWLASSQSEFLRDRFVWSNWDVEEMMAMKEEIVEKDLLKFKLDGWDRYPNVLPFQ